jgi:hypothetical protein
MRALQYPALRVVATASPVKTLREKSRPGFEKRLPAAGRAKTDRALGDARA